MSAASKATPRPATGLTPSASSPPRSVPSPAHLHAPSPATQSRAPYPPKSPHKRPAANTPHNVTSTPHLCAGTPHAHVGTPTPRYEGLAAAGLGSSPMAARSVTGSELGGGTPALMNALGMANGGLGMHFSLSGMGLGTPQLQAAQMGDGGVGALDGEEELQRRVGAMVALLGRRWGRVGREGVERCARRVGLECLWEGDEAVGRSTLSIAGNGLLVEMEWDGEVVGGVVLSFPGAEGADRSAAVGAKVLRGDLVGGEKREYEGYVGLEAFAKNLGRLARMDVLGREGVSCFEAVEGLRVAMDRLWEWELSKMKEEHAGRQEREMLEREVMCTRSGRPMMHGNGKIGLRLDYWMDRRLIPPERRRADEMDVDNPAPDSDLETDADSHTLYSLFIDCESCPSSLYPSIRISDAWVSETVEKKVSLDDTLFTADPSPIDWQEPPLTFKPSTDLDSEAMTLDAHIALPSKLPDIRFIAHVVPPITLPLQKAIEIFNLVDSPLTQDAMEMTTYTGLLLPSTQAVRDPDPLVENSALEFERVVRSWSASGVPTEYEHQYSLLTHQQDWARTVSQIPFSHPRQLVVIMPLLRQWAFLGSMLRRTFGVEDASTEAPSASQRKKPAMNGTGDAANGHARRRHAVDSSRKAPRPNRPRTPPSDTDSDTDADAGASILTANPPPTSPDLPTRLLDVSLALSANMAPALAVTVPLPEGESQTTIFHVGLNAEVRGEGDGIGDGDGDGSVNGRGGGERVLSVMEDVGGWVEWVLR